MVRYPSRSARGRHSAQGNRVVCWIFLASNLGRLFRINFHFACKIREKPKSNRLSPKRLNHNVCRRYFLCLNREKKLSRRFRRHTDFASAGTYESIAGNPIQPDPEAPKLGGRRGMEFVCGDLRTHCLSHDVERRTPGIGCD